MSSPPSPHFPAARAWLVLSLLLWAASLPAQDFEVLFSDNEGKYPYANVIEGSDGCFYGTAHDGGASDHGTVYKITPSGIHTVLLSFNGTNGSGPYGALVQGSDGNFYGTTYEGGANNYGTVFRLTPSGTHTVLHSFNSTQGKHPRAGLVQGSDGDYYGTTFLGGSPGAGTVFKITAGGTHTVLFHFNGTQGSHPYGALVQGSDGDFYGTTFGGGVGGSGITYSLPGGGVGSGDGTVFKISPGGTQTVLHSFNGNDGRWPMAGLVRGSDGDFYGTNQYGGGDGNVFKISSTGTYTVLYSFTGTGGSHPRAGLVQGDDGDFYGTTYEGGASDYGTVFKVSPTGSHTLLHTFNANQNFGRHPVAGLVKGSDGLFYGTTLHGIGLGDGTVFKISPTGTHTVLKRFNSSTGRNIGDALVQGTDGHFYGTASEGGSYYGGTAFKITASGNLSVLHAFISLHTGSLPSSGLVQGSDGAFYGTTSRGEGDFNGKVFKITADGAITVMHSFTNPTGRNPQAGLVQGDDGAFYGTTTLGGANNKGTVYKITPSGSHSVLHSFSNAGGTEPRSGVVQGSDGAFYGTTYFGGVGSRGTVYRVTSGGSYTVLHSFSQSTGRNPMAGLVEGSDGDFYGTTLDGGTADHGTVFKISPSGSLTVLHSFTGVDGSQPYAGLVEGSNGYFYGATLTGGANGYGTVFRITSSGAHRVLYTFDGISAAKPLGTPAFGNDGKLYGTAQSMVIWRLNVDTATQPPSLTAPALISNTSSPISVSFTLPEAALPGSVKLGFGATQFTLASSQETAGVHSFTFDPAHPTASPEIASGGPIVDGSYTVTLSYQDTEENPVASVSSPNVTVDTTAPTGGSMTLSPASPMARGGPLTVTFADWVDDRSPLSYEVLIDGVVVSSAGSAASVQLRAPSSATGPTSYSLKGRIRDTLGNTTEVTQSIDVFLTPGQQQFSADMLAAGLTGPDVTAASSPQNDGVTNLEKYAFNLDLLSRDNRILTPGTGTAGLPVITFPSAGVMRLEYLRRIGSGLIYSPKKGTSPQPGSWQNLSSTATVTPIDANWERVQHDEPFTPGSTPAMYGTVEVTLP